MSSSFDPERPYAPKNEKRRRTNWPGFFALLIAVVVLATGAGYLLNNSDSNGHHLVESEAPVQLGPFGGLPSSGKPNEDMVIAAVGGFGTPFDKDNAWYETARNSDGSNQLCKGNQVYSVYVEAPGAHEKAREAAYQDGNMWTSKPGASAMMSGVYYSTDAGTNASSWNSVDSSSCSEN